MTRRIGVGAITGIVVMLAAAVAGCDEDREALDPTAPPVAVEDSCRRCGAPEPDWILEATADGMGFDLLDPLVAAEGGWRFQEEYRTVGPFDHTREASELTGRGGTSPAVQAWYVDSADGSDWNEFLWEEPQWSERRAEDSTWVTREEPGAFEPPYRFAYFTELAMPTVLAAMAEERVFEGTVDADGVTLVQYCTEHSDPVPPSLAGMFRFLVHPDGYVTEWVAWVDDEEGAECMEGTLQFAPSLDVRGRHGGAPPTWMTDLAHLPSCRAAYLAAEAAWAGVPESPTSPPVGDPPATALAGAWHEVVDAECAAAAEAATRPDDEAIEAMATGFDEWAADAPGEVERAALERAAAALRSKDTRSDFAAMDAIGQALIAAGMPQCGSLFISG